MKTIAAAALILTLTASAFAMEPQQAPEPEKAQAPIVLSGSQLDGVTAGAEETQVENISLSYSKIMVNYNDHDASKELPSLTTSALSQPRLAPGFFLGRRMELRGGSHKWFTAAARL